MKKCRIWDTDKIQTESLMIQLQARNYSTEQITQALRAVNVIRLMNKKESLEIPIAEGHKIKSVENGVVENGGDCCTECGSTQLRISGTCKTCELCGNAGGCG